MTAPAGRRGLVALLIAGLSLTGCDPDRDPLPDDPEPDVEATDPGVDTDDDGPDGVEPDDVEVPEVQTIPLEDVIADAEPGTLDGAIASAAEDLPNGWHVAVVADPVLGPYLLGLPETATVWRVGDDLGALEEAASDEAWWRYWGPILTEADDAGDSSSLRAAAVVLPPVGDGGDELHLTITATPRQDLPVDDPESLADSFADTFRQQRLTVEEATTATAGDAEVAALTLTTPEDEFDDGVPRRLRQWFYPEVDAPVLWSLTCEGPGPAADVIDEVCPVVLTSFRTPPR